VDATKLMGALPAPGSDIRQTIVEPLGKGFRRRALAYVIDLAAIGVLTAALGVIDFVGLVLLQIALSLFGRELRFGGPAGEAPALQLLDGVLTSLLYFVACEWLAGGSVGKWVCGMVVVRLDSRRCNLWAALVRGVLRFVDALFFGLPAYLSMNETPRLQQRLGDRLAHTVVVDRRDPFVRQAIGWWRLPLALATFAALALLWIVVYQWGSGQVSICPCSAPAAPAAIEAHVRAAEASPVPVLRRGLVDGGSVHASHSPQVVFRTRGICAPVHLNNFGV
jgi:uncharacterized RDD family membrane protein YckC